jgi:hypothetical protein
MVAWHSTLHKLRPQTTGFSPRLRRHPEGEMAPGLRVAFTAIALVLLVATGADAKKKRVKTTFKELKCSACKVWISPAATLPLAPQDSMVCGAPCGCGLVQKSNCMCLALSAVLVRSGVCAVFRIPWPRAGEGSRRPGCQARASVADASRPEDDIGALLGAGGGQ